MNVLLFINVNHRIIYINYKILNFKLWKKSSMSEYMKKSVSFDPFLTCDPFQGLTGEEKTKNGQEKVLKVWK